ncbi:MAG TPA: hypothetical protein DF383_01150 [Deltaproteobacteria bacterium]|nr:hypothetical protein [Deltaproteobacteria bacterium]
MKNYLIKFIKSALPWAVALGLFYYLFQKVPPAQVLRSLRLVPVGYFIGFGLIYFLTLLTLDTAMLSRVLTRFDAPIRFFEVLPGRCVTYLVALLNYNAGQAALALYLKRRRGVSFFKTLGCIFFISVIDLYWVIFLAFLGTFFFVPTSELFPIGAWVRNLAYLAFAAMILHLAFWRGCFGRILPERFHFRLGDWLRGRHLFQAFHHATLADYFRMALLRFPIHATVISAFWVVVRLSGAKIAFHEIAAATPIILLLGAIPLTPGGLGAVQIATVKLLQDRVVIPAALGTSVRPDELLLGLSLAWMTLNYSIKALSGLLSLAFSPASLYRETNE